MKKIIVATLISLVGFQSVQAEDLDPIFAKVKEYTAAKNYQKALNELTWAKNEIEKLNVEKLKSFFPDTLAGLKGEEIQANSVMGISNVERGYSGSGFTVKASLTGLGGAGEGNPLGGIAQLGQMAAMFGGQQPGMESFRIGEFSAQGEKTDSNASVTVFTQSGSILKFESSDATKYDTVKEVAKKFDIAGLEKYLKGEG